jgi:hypothetical protein
MGDKDEDKTAKKPDGPGGVQHDTRGNAVWQWAVESGRHVLESTSQLLKRLDVPGLKLEDDPEVLKDKAAAQEPGDPAGPLRSVGYDPYGRASAGTGRRAGKVAKVTARPAQSAIPPQPSKPPQLTRPPLAAKPRESTKTATAAKPAPSLLRRLFRRD